MSYISREKKYQELFPQAPKYRFQQIEAALFDSAITNWLGVSTLPKKEREILEQNLAWLSFKEFKTFTSHQGDTHKAILETNDGLKFETVLMQNQRGDWSICVSSQIGCAMGCTFCATGTMGLTRNLDADEIVDQYRYWQIFLKKNIKTPQRISNVVFMGMGEPLANYVNLKKTLNTWLKNTDLGPTKITVSSVGILPILNKLLVDPDWPPVKIAISLHSANQQKRESIVPSTSANFLKDLTEWSNKYSQMHGNRQHHITFEYTLINEVNDTPELAEELASYVAKAGRVKINVIPLNHVVGKSFTASQQQRIDNFKRIILNHGLDITQRKTMGEDIAAACGQLVVNLNKDEANNIN